MTIPDSRADQSVLIAEYVLGLLEGEAAREVEEWIRTDRGAAGMALQWEDHLLALSDRMVPQEVDAALWARVAERLAAQPQVTTSQRREDAEPSRWDRFWNDVRMWRWASIGLATAVVVFTVAPFLTAPDRAVPRVAVLQQPGQSAQPGWVVSVLHNGDVQIRGLSPLPTPEGRSVQIWTLAPGEAKPRSLGLLADRQSVVIPSDQIGPVQPGQLFEFTLEQAGGSPTQLPTGPILYIGRIVAAVL